MSNPHVARHKKRKRMRTIFALLMIASNAFAFDQPAVEWTGGQTVFIFDPYTLGFRFRVSADSDVEVAALGAFDLDGDGLRFPHTVAIWPLWGGTPIASATVQTGAVAFLEGHFRYVNITPIRLSKDTEYIISASDYGGTNFVYEPAAFNAQGFTNSARITWLATREMAGWGFQFSATDIHNEGQTNGFFGPNFQFSPIPSIPRAEIHVSEVAVCWTSETNKSYRVQYQSALTTNEWVDLTAPIEGTGTNNCIRDPVPFAAPKRFYRILALP